VQSTFEDIYSLKLWGGDGDGSGSGSRISVTGATRLIVELVVLKYGLTSITDAPCGAMRWMPLALRRISATVPCLRYTGVDVVRDVIAGADVKVAGALPPGQASFLVWDIAAAPLPLSAAHELVLCRDALQVRV
jgi:hypothetical protein